MLHPSKDGLFPAKAFRIVWKPEEKKNPDQTLFYQFNLFSPSTFSTSPKKLMRKLKLVNFCFQPIEESLEM